MNIIYYFRNPIDGISICRVFDTISQEISKSTDIKKIYMPYKDVCILQNMLYVWLHKKHNDIYHITGNIHYLSLILPKNKTITTLHDLSRLDSDNNIIKNPFRRYIYKLFFLYPLKRNRFIVCISECTKTRLLEQLNIDSKKIIVIPNAVGKEFVYTPKKQNKNKPIILHIGTGWNKNLKRTIIALQNLNIHLRIIGKLDNEVIKLLKTTKTDYSNDLNISDEQIVEEYKKCDFINFPSEYEGFGMPIIEGQAIGRVVITSNLSPMKEIACNGSAYIVDPFNINSIRNAYIELIKNETLREHIIKLGLINSKKYTDSNISTKYLYLYNTLNNNTNGKLIHR